MKNVNWLMLTLGQRLGEGEQEALVAVGVVKTAC